ncbi:hypothetical protein KDW_59940 [Dictyobacter vulcani]|uniref:Uncharacterized protein n=1 Tax=Dictyobacter vulcani TaxID=2607529 RepID=A0A5J4KXM9_9CHLR|nr:hypothetical protein [Dictyobacter vulcani]GER91832.1 hypothetical protein KDW_59940 [Dictyobacter vulcani]
MHHFHRWLFRLVCCWWDKYCCTALAGIAVDINHYLITHKQTTLGHANPALYRLYNTPQPTLAYHDIISGNNLYYPATEGYDLATGLGSPDAWNIAQDLAGIVGPPH